MFVNGIPLEQLLAEKARQRQVLPVKEITAIAVHDDPDEVERLRHLKQLHLHIMLDRYRIAH